MPSGELTKNTSDIMIAIILTYIISLYQQNVNTIFTNDLHKNPSIYVILTYKTAKSDIVQTISDFLYQKLLVINNINPGKQKCFFFFLTLYRL